MAIFNNQILDNRHKTFGIKPSGIFMPGQGIIDENVSVQPEINGPINAPPATAFPKLMSAPPNLGMSSYPDVENYRSALRQQPKREEHQLGKWGKALAFGSGLAEGYNRGVQPGIETGLGLMDRPYNRALADWKDRTSGAGELANLEVKLDEIGRKRIDDQYKMMYDYNKNLIDWEEAKSRFGLNEAQIRNYDSQVRNRQAEFREIGGRGYMIHRLPNGRQIIEDLEVGETASQTRAANEEVRNRELGTLLDNAIKLERERQGGDIESIKQRFVGEESMLRLRYDLEKEMRGGGVSPENFEKAFDLAVKQMDTMQPELISQLFDNVNGTLVPKNLDRKDLWDTYRNNIRQRTNELLGWTGQKPTTPAGTTSGWPARNTPISPTDRRSQGGIDESTLGAQINEALRILAPNNPELQTDSVSRNRVRDEIRKDPDYLQKLRESQTGQSVPEVPQIQLPHGATNIPRIQLPPQPQPSLSFQGRPLTVSPPRYNGIFGPIDVPVGMGPIQQPTFPLTRGERRAGYR